MSLLKTYEGFTSNPISNFFTSAYNKISKALSAKELMGEYTVDDRVIEKILNVIKQKIQRGDDLKTTISTTKYAIMMVEDNKKLTDKKDILEHLNGILKDLEEAFEEEVYLKTPDKKKRKPRKKSEPKKTVKKKEVIKKAEPIKTVEQPTKPPTKSERKKERKELIKKYNQFSDQIKKN